MKYITAIIKLLSFLIFSVIICLPQLVVLLFSKKKLFYKLPQIWHRAVCFIFNIKVHVHGDISTDAQTLFVSNHISYLDIPAIGGLLNASFIAKSDVEGWPVFGFLSKLQRTIFIRRDRAAFQKARDKVQQRLHMGHSLILFAEGTSTDGHDILPLKSGLFSLVEPDKDTAANTPPLRVQPMTVRIDTTNGVSLQNGGERDIYAWHGDMELAPHLWQLAKSRGAEISLFFHPPLDSAVIAKGRKEIAKTCHATMKDALHPVRAE